MRGSEGRQLLLEFADTRTQPLHLRYCRFWLKQVHRILKSVLKLYVGAPIIATIGVCVLVRRIQEDYAFMSR